MLATEVAYAQLGPGMPFGRAYPEPVEDRGDALVRQHASEFADQLFGRGVGLPAMLAGAVLDDFEARVITASPMQHEAQAVWFNSNDDFLEDGAQNSLAGFGGRRGMV